MKQKVALGAVIVICILVLLTLITAIFDASGKWFRSFLMLAIAAPILAWIYIWLYGLLEKKHTIASVDMFQTDGTADGKDAESGEDL